MRKIKELLGLPVLDLSTGDKIGEVKDVLLDVTLYRMVAILLCRAGWFHSGKGIPTEQLRSIGDDIITVDSETVIVDEQEFGRGNHLYLDAEIIGKQIITTSGTAVGTLADIYVDTRTGMLTGYEISDSVIQDLLDGRKALFLPVPQVIGKETVIIADEAVQLNQPVGEDKPK